MSVSVIAIVAVALVFIAVVMLREAAIHGPGLPGQEQLARERRDRRRALASRPRRGPLQISGPAIKAAGAGLAGGAAAAVVGLAVGTLAILAALAWWH